MTGRELIAALAVSRPNVAITVERTHYPDGVWDGDDPLDFDRFICYGHEVTAMTIRNGQIVTGSAYMGGSWYEPGDTSDCAPEISGYLHQMVEEAIEELDKALAERSA